MRIPSQEAIISPEKLTRYLLARRTEDDKSRWLAQAGFTQDNPVDLEAAIRQMLESYDAVQDRSNIYGEFYRVEGDLVGVKWAGPACGVDLDSEGIGARWKVPVRDAQAGEESRGMKPELFSRVVLNRDIPEENLRMGDVATLVEYVEHPHGGEEGAILEVFNALGETLDIATVPVSAIEPLRPEHVPTVRLIEPA